MKLRESYGEVFRQADNYCETKGIRLSLYFPRCESPNEINCRKREEAGEKNEITSWM